MVNDNGIQTYVCWRRYIDRTYDLRPVYTGNDIADGKKQCQMEGGKTLERVGSWKAHFNSTRLNCFGTNNWEMDRK